MLQEDDQFDIALKSSARGKSKKELERDEHEKEKQERREAREVVPIENIAGLGYEIGDKGANWRMVKLKRVFDAANAEARDVQEIALERYGVILI